MVSSLCCVLEPTSSNNMIVEGLQLWNRATNEEYKRLMEGAMMEEEKNECIQDAISFIKNEVDEEGSNVHNTSVHFASHMKEICSVVSRLC